MSDTSFDAILIDNRKRKRIELQQKLDSLMGEWMEQVLDLDEKSTAICNTMRTIVDYDAYVRERRTALFIARVMEPVELEPLKRG